jgi:hypothetical protein
MKASRRASSFSPAPTLARLAPSQAVDEELLWFFNAEDGDFASVSNFGRMLAPVTEDGEWRTPEDHARARHRHGVIRSHLKSIPDVDAGVLQCAYAPRPWPVALAKELGRLTGIVVRLSCDQETWPEERGRQLAVDAENAEGLHLMLRVGGDENRSVLRDLRREAQGRLAHALGEYLSARRGRWPSRVQ